MKNFATFLLIILLIACIVGIGVLGYRSKGFKDWSFLEQEQPDQSEEPPADVKPDDNGQTPDSGSGDQGGSTTPGGNITPEPTQCNHVFSYVNKEKYDFNSMANIIGQPQVYGSDYVDGFSLGAMDEWFIMMTKDQQSWDFLYPVLDNNNYLDSIRLLAHSDNGFENVSFQLTSAIEIVNIVLIDESYSDSDYGHEYFEVTYRVNTYYCSICGEAKYV